jgi:hypothetical protein
MASGLFGDGIGPIRSTTLGIPHFSRGRNSRPEARRTPGPAGAKILRMAQKGFLQKKREILEFYGAISTYPPPEVVEKIRDGDVAAIAEFYRGVQEWVTTTLELVLRKCCATLQTPEGWSGLAETPEKFDQAVKQCLTGAERCMKLLYNIPDHKPQTQAVRDARLVALREKNPSVSWGELALAYKREFNEAIPANVAERQVKRALDRAKREKADVVKRAIQAAEVFLANQNLPSERLYELLPTPEAVLNFLVSSNA